MRTLLAILLTACVVVPAPAVHAQADVGLAETSDTSRAAPEPLELRLRAAFARLPELSDVEVTAGDGVVTLRGVVGRAESRSAAEQIAAKVDGALWVDNRIRVQDTAEPETADDDPTAADAAIRERLAAIFANVDELRAVQVTVRAGVVRLEGEVLRPETVEKAEALARTIDGVVYVDNALTEVRAVQERISPAFARAREVAANFVATLPLFAVAIVIFMLFVLAARAVTASAFLFRRLDDKPLVQGIVRQVVRVGIIGTGALVVLELFNLTALAGAVLGTAGVAGLAIGFAFKDIVENYLASLMLSVRQPFDKDDIVRIADYEGKVVRLSTRETVLMTLDGNHLRIPNAVVFKSVIVNFSRNPLRRLDFTVGLGVGEDIAAAMQVGLDALNATRGVLAEPAAFVVIDRLGDFTVDLHYYAWVDQREMDYLAAKSRAIRRVKEAYDAASIDMPEPTQRVLHRQWEPPPKEARVRAEPSSAPEVEPVATDQIDEQIAQDRAASDEPDLLK